MYSERGVAYFTDASNATGYTYFDARTTTAFPSGYIIQLTAGPTNINDGVFFASYFSKTPTSFRIVPEAPFFGEVAWFASVK